MHGNSHKPALATFKTHNGTLCIYAIWENKNTKVKLINSLLPDKDKMNVFGCHGDEPKFWGLWYSAKHKQCSSEYQNHCLIVVMLSLFPFCYNSKQGRNGISVKWGVRFITQLKFGQWGNLLNILFCRNILKFYWPT